LAEMALDSIWPFQPIEFHEVNPSAAAMAAVSIQEKRRSYVVA